MQHTVDIHEILQESLFVAVKMGAPSLLASLAAGILISLFQAVTQVNEATLSFVPKFVAAMLALMLTSSFIYATLHNYAMQIFDQMVIAGGS
ncbi:MULTISPECIES: flagellar biosynthetic protein FliQ [Asaia]|uniref:Flagellar biosynthetic protein FliQ n=1 Tax=Asaia bogorensis NBRC 16594 TaxID=1231624 RepID=A0AAN4R213_9PROT|nr:MULTISPECIES: flagellar biosynthetic protein FliQ [Asaia]ETC97950.1 flagellar biosynthesis protein FliQ [Asaia sp. SF2.1]MDL2170561.1 flagellar biosynthetic protein FliQ [Asaia sp. HumB]NIE79432.1 flagellar biosynthetic protein FliQ [Asaia sp. As-1742]BAT20587.1 flagellar biosynthetic export protein fliQ [Asaia bogorensis NBRC 16594]GBQ76607.1 flagellar biosynthetic protein FliQ [Asaia bogorensis NBRC 16594]